MQRELPKIVYPWDSALGYLAAGERPEGVESNLYAKTLQKLFPVYKSNTIIAMISQHAPLEKHPEWRRAHKDRAVKNATPKRGRKRTKPV